MNTYPQAGYSVTASMQAKDFSESVQNSDEGQFWYLNNGHNERSKVSTRNVKHNSLKKYKSTRLHHQRNLV
jgi:hypothetical protein